MKKKAAVMFSVALLLIAALFVYVMDMFYTLALDPHGSKDKIAQSKDIDVDFLLSMRSKDAADWVKTAAVLREIKAFDGLTLKGYELKQPEYTHKWAVVVHGYMMNPSDMADIAKAFYDKGFNVFVPHLRGHGLSEGDYIGMGWDDRKDIISWADMLISDNGDSQITLYGLSMGASTVLMASGEMLPPNIKCIIADSAYTSAWDVFAYQLKQMFGLPPFPLLYGFAKYAELKTGYNIKDASAMNQVRKSRVPILFIQGSADTFIPFDMVGRLYSSAMCKKIMLIIYGAGHGATPFVEPEKYWQKVFEFADKWNAAE